MRKTLLVSGVAAISALVLSACSSSDHASMSGMSSSASAPAPAPSRQAAGHNADDIAFAQQMVPHHSQALDMAKLVPSRSTNPKVVDLASRIEKAQDPEIRQMQGWLTAWGAPSASSTPGMPGMDHGSTGSMPGMMSDADMQKLGQAKGAEFDKMWLDMMIQHHQGAVEMARTELSKGSNADAKALAQKIIDTQQAEITEMQGLLSQS
ncbi:DUF305 domain-containing protein [Amycolatopsis sp. MtRt-6]|uniref:DUF305 domain-containing protein n=1 Tax=Amycolatopsis sp. MtRt-6 TaxID=2792782 RepID=UPI001A907792|nr:DUF305 domain-containing protein [Amycolatopsis sp. MtRt-6]